MNALIAALPKGSEPPDSPASSPGGGWGSWAPLIVILVVFYLFLIRPASKREKQRREMLKALAKHDKVVTTGGLLGTVVSIDAETVTLEVARDVRVRFLRSAIHSIERPAESKPAEAEAKKAEAKG